MKNTSVKGIDATIVNQVQRLHIPRSYNLLAALRTHCSISEKKPPVSLLRAPRLPSQAATEQFAAGGTYPLHLLSVHNERTAALLVHVSDARSRRVTESTLLYEKRIFVHRL